jgi:hypothetical protein
MSAQFIFRLAVSWHDGDAKAKVAKVIAQQSFTEQSKSLLKMRGGHQSKLCFARVSGQRQFFFLWKIQQRLFRLINVAVF